MIYFNNIFVLLFLVDALAVIYKSRFLIFKDCQDDSHVGFIATHVSPALDRAPSYAGVIHALYLHGASNVMFDPMMAASSEIEDEYIESLARIARELTKASETHNLETGFAHIVDSDDGASQETTVDENMLEEQLAKFHSVRQSSQVYCDQCVLLQIILMYLSSLVGKRLPITYPPRQMKWRIRTTRIPTTKGSCFNVSGLWAMVLWRRRLAPAAAARATALTVHRTRHPF